MLNFIFRMFACLIFTMAFHHGTAWSKPQPVDGVFQMYDGFNKLEGELRGSKWAEAEETISAINAYYVKLSQVLKKTVEVKIVNKFGFLILKIKRDAYNKDREAAEASYMNLQEHFLEIMGHYEYPVPPALTIYARYINEAREGIEIGDFHETAEEMEEIIELRSYGEEAFREKGVSASGSNSFFENVESVEKAARLRDLVKVQKGLKELETFINKYLPQEGIENK